MASSSPSSPFLVESHHASGSDDAAVHAAVQAQLTALQADERAYTDLRTRLVELPRKTRHPGLVPLAPHVFLPGALVRTNELYVALGESHRPTSVSATATATATATGAGFDDAAPLLVERSAYQAEAIVERRLARLRAQIERLCRTGDVTVAVDPDPLPASASASAQTHVQAGAAAAGSLHERQRQLLQEKETSVKLDEKKSEKAKEKGVDTAQAQPRAKTVHDGATMAAGTPTTTTTMASTKQKKKGGKRVQFAPEVDVQQRGRARTGAKDGDGTCNGTGKDKGRATGRDSGSDSDSNSDSDNGSVKGDKKRDLRVELVRALQRAHEQAERDGVVNVMEVYKGDGDGDGNGDGCGGGDDGAPLAVLPAGFVPDESVSFADDSVEYLDMTMRAAAAQADKKKGEKGDEEEEGEAVFSWENREQYFEQLLEAEAEAEAEARSDAEAEAAAAAKAEKNGAQEFGSGLARGFLQASGGKLAARADTGGGAAIGGVGERVVERRGPRSRTRTRTRVAGVGRVSERAQRAAAVNEVGLLAQAEEEAAEEAAAELFATDGVGKVDDDEEGEAVVSRFKAMRAARGGGRR